MRQQINLFQSVLIDKPEPLQSRQVGLILLGFVVLLALLSLLSYWQLWNAKSTLNDLAQQKSNLEQKVLALEQQFPERQKSALLEEEIARHKERLVGQRQLLSYFTVRREDGKNDMLGILDGLARHRSTGVWLRKIQLSAAGDEMLLAGSALRPEQVPQYVQSLGKQGVLAGQVFDRMQLTRLKEKPGQVDFSLESVKERK